MYIARYQSSKRGRLRRVTVRALLAGLALCAMSMVVLAPASVAALAPGDCHDSNGTAQCLIDVYANPIISLLSAAVGVLVVITIVYGSIEFIQSGGDPGKAASGKKHITNALIGLAAFLMLYAFLQFILPGGLLHG